MQLLLGFVGLIGLIGFVASFFLCSLPAQADEKEWQNAYSAGMQAVKAGKAMEAEKALSTSLELANELTNKPNCLLLSCEALGKLYAFTKRPEKAEPLFKRVVEIGEKAGGQNVSTLVGSEHLAEIYAAQGRYDEALQYTKRAVALQEMINPSGPEAILLRRRVVGIYLKTNQPDAAIQFLQESATQKEKGAKVEAALQALDELSSFYMRKGDYAAAEPVIKRAANLAASKLGQGDFAVAKELHYLVEAELRQNKLDAALKNAQQEYNIVKNKYGENHQNIVPPLLNLAKVYEAAGQTQQANQFKAQAEAIMKSAGAGGGQVGAGNSGTYRPPRQNLPSNK